MEAHFEYEADSKRHWSELHRLARFRPRYPSEHTVRFLMSFPSEKRASLRALDIGVGGGRHTKMLCELGFQTFGIDQSEEGLRQCEAWLKSLEFSATLRHASMFNLPFADGNFDLALSFGVFYYADRAGVARAVEELFRVLVPGGSALVLMRTTADYRFGKGTPLEKNSYRLEIDDTNEQGAVMHFLDEGDVPVLFSKFSGVQFEKAETTFKNRAVLDSDWVITVRK